jgi:hypothetical protein
MLSLEAIRKNLGVYANDYSEEELIAARRDLYQFANFACDYYYKRKQTINNKIN